MTDVVTTIELKIHKHCEINVHTKNVLSTLLPGIDAIANTLNATNRPKCAKYEQNLGWLFTLIGFTVRKHHFPHFSSTFFVSFADSKKHSISLFITIKEIFE